MAFKQKTLSLALLIGLSASLTAHAATFYMAMPKTMAFRAETGASTNPGSGSGSEPTNPEPPAPEPTNPVSLTLVPVSLMTANVGTFYQHDFKAALTITGDNAPNINQITWQIINAPGGMVVSPYGGVLMGTPWSVGSPHSFTVRATYDSVVAEQTYELTIYPAAPEPGPPD